MSPFPVLMNPTARRMATTYAVTVGMMILVLSAVWAPLPIQLDPVTAWLATAILALSGGGWLLLQLRHLLHLETQLACLVEGDWQLAPATGSRPVDHGWNRLVEASRQWRALHELEQQLAAGLQDRRGRGAPPLLDSLSDGIVTVDASGMITYANSAVAAMCGVESCDPLLGRPLGEAFGADPVATDQLRAPTHQPLAVVEWSVPNGSGERIFRGSRRPGRKSDGASIAFVWTIRDVTQQRLADSMRDKFLATATHEFRTPLANIRAYAESLEMGDELDPESRKRFYNIIQSESLRLSQLVDDLLDISQMQAGAMALDCKETDLGRLVEEISKKVEGEMLEKQIEFRCELPPKYPKLMIDKGKLSAALVNLLGNAAKYTPQGGRVTFRVDLTPRSVEFAISDTGIGIAPDELPRVFERFYRSHDERVRDITGSGLGLALSQEVARLHGGEITAESVLHQGSTFHMNIPLGAVAA